MSFNHGSWLSLRERERERERRWQGRSRNEREEGIKLAKKNIKIYIYIYIYIIFNYLAAIVNWYRYHLTLVYLLKNLTFLLLIYLACCCVCWLLKLAIWLFSTITANALKSRL